MSYLEFYYLFKPTLKVIGFATVSEKAGSMIDTVAPWLGPIGIGLKVATTFVGLFVGKKEMSMSEIANENLRLNKQILDSCSTILEEIKEVKMYIKYEKDLKKFRSTYDTYRELLI